MSDVMSILTLLFEHFHSERLSKSKKNDDALRSLHKALHETNTYLKLVNKPDHKDISKEMELSNLWGIAAISMRHLSPDLAERCSIKGDYWKDPNQWSFDRVKDHRIALVDMEKELKCLIKGGRPAAHTFSGQEETEPRNHHSENPKKIRWGWISGGIIVIAAIVTILAYFGIDGESLLKKKPISSENKEITLFTTFQEDFNNLLRHSEDRILTLNDGSQVTIKTKAYLDFEAQTIFIGFFIPNTPQTYDLCVYLSENFESVLALKEKVMVESSSPGLQPVNSSELIFSGRVFIYHEYPLLATQKRELFSLYTKNKLSPQFRGSEYVFNTDFHRLFNRHKKASFRGVMQSRLSRFLCSPARVL